MVIMERGSNIVMHTYIHNDVHDNDHNDDVNVNDNDIVLYNIHVLYRVL